MYRDVLMTCERVWNLLGYFAKRNHGGGMKIVKKMVWFIFMTGCVAGCFISCRIWKEQKNMLEDVDNMMDMEHETVYGVDIEDSAWWDYSSDVVGEILKEEEKRRDGLEKETGPLRTNCCLQGFIERQGNAPESSNEVWQKYFHIRQGELARIEGIEDLSECGTFGFLNNIFSGVTFDLYDGITLQYQNGTTGQIEEYGLPMAVIITGSESDLGFMDARAGMDFAQIMENAYEEEVRQGFMSGQIIGGDTVYYIQYTDEMFHYSFISEKEDGSGSKLIVTKLAEEMPQVGRVFEKEGMEVTAWSHWMEAVEFEEIEKKHEILAYDISTSPRYDYENTPLRDYIDKEKEENQRDVEKFGSHHEMRVDYHVFDFNDDGIEDYLLCIDGIGYSGTAGHCVELFVGKEDGSAEEILHVNLHFHNENMPSGHERFTVLNEKTGGFYAIVLPGSNRILRYDLETGGYEFQETE